MSQTTINHSSRTFGKSAPQNRGTSKTLRVLLAVLVVLLLHLPLLLLKPGASQTIAPQEHKTLAALPSKGTEGAESLWQFISMIEPSQWFYPTADGFSRFNKKKALPPPELPTYAFQKVLLPAVTFDESHLALGELPAEDTDFLKLPVFTSLPPKKEGTIPMVLARWRRVGGGTLLPEHAPKVTAESIEMLKNRGSLNFNGNPSPTRMEVQYRPGFSMPRILLRDSCGNAALDQCAINALREALHANGADSKQFQRLTDCLLEVDWLL